MIAVILGGASGVWSEYAALRKLVQPDLIVACNDAGAVCPHKLDAWCTLHPEKFESWMGRRQAKDYKAYTIKGRYNLSDVTIVPERWAGSSGLYAAQIAFDELGATKVVFCGVPLTAQAKHFFDPSDWVDAENYRRGFKAALTEISEKARSMSGWTAELLGVPDTEWLNDWAA